MKTRSMLLLALALLVTSFSHLFAQEGKISGYMFGDYFYEFSHPDQLTDAQNRNGFQFRRIYFTYDRDFSEKFSARFRLEMNNADFGKSDQLIPYVKHAYLNWKKFIPNGNLLLGISDTPTFYESDKVWGYRSIEKTLMDLRKVASSADFGVAVQGKIGESSVLNYHLMVANGAGVKGETDKNKRIYASIPIKFRGTYFIVPYIDYEGGNDGKDKNTVAFFAGIQGSGLHGGIEVFRKTSNQATLSGEDKIELGYSVFGAVKAANKVKLFGRFDRYDPDADIDENGNTLIIAGLDYAADKNVNVMPNVKIESYELNGIDSSVIGAVTLFFRF